MKISRKIVNWPKSNN